MVLVEVAAGDGLTGYGIIHGSPLKAMPNGDPIRRADLRDDVACSRDHLEQAFSLTAPSSTRDVQR